MKNKIKRAIVINYNNGAAPTELEIKKAVSVKSDNSFIYFEKFKGEWKLTFSDDVVEDFSTIKNFEILRED